MCTYVAISVKCTTESYNGGCLPDIQCSALYCVVLYCIIDPIRLNSIYSRVLELKTDANVSISIL